MKKFLVSAVMAVMALGAFAQDWYAGGAFGFWRNSGDNVTSFQILPEVGFNLSDNLAIGTTVGYDYSYEDGIKRSLVVFNPYVRYAFFKNGNVSIFCDGGVDLGFGKAKANGQSSDTAVTYGIGLAPGVAYSLSDNFSIVAHVGFIGYRGGNNASYVPDQGGVLLDGNDLSFGFYYNF